MSKFDRQEKISKIILNNKKKKTLSFVPTITKFRIYRKYKDILLNGRDRLRILKRDIKIRRNIFNKQTSNEIRNN